MKRGHFNVKGNIARLLGGQHISQDLLNKIAPSGMPPPKLTLKEGAPVVLLRNLHDARGQANADTQA